nr:unnamed protein product [Spirometra erinaceieuropaei]
MVGIAPLSETRFPEQGQLEEVGAGCTFFWSGCPKVDLRDADAALEVQNDIVRRLSCLPLTIDRLMTLRLSVRKSKFAIIVSVYVSPSPQRPALTKQRPSSTKICTLSWQMCKRQASWLSLVTSVPASRHRAAWRQVLRAHEITGYTDKGLLLRTFAEYLILLTNTFRLPTRKTTWVHP